MIKRVEISYLGITAEAVAIVLSILLAFAIDAAWEQRQKKRASAQHSLRSQLISRKPAH